MLHVYSRTSVERLGLSREFNEERETKSIRKSIKPNSVCFKSQERPVRDVLENLYRIQIAHHVTAEDLPLSLTSVLRIIMELANVSFPMKQSGWNAAVPALR